MSHLSPSVFMSWGVMTAALAAFYVYHLWHFDRFRCLRMSCDGSFKRFMAYSYIITLPFLLVYTIGFSVIKYREGYVTLPSGSVIPKPYELWTQKHQVWNYPLNMMCALAWGTHAVSHLEELCFWFFLIYSGHAPTSWFKSIYFNIWVGGSVFGMILVPVVTAITKHNPVRNEAWMLFAGSAMATVITVGFLPILWVFPAFVQKVKNEGAESRAITRLATYHDLNITRVAFRFLFVVPLLILAVDGIMPHSHRLNESVVLTELLAMLLSIGLVVQSAITLIIFFPRNVELETRRWLRDPPPKLPQSFSLAKLRKRSKDSRDDSKLDRELDHDNPRYLLTGSPVQSSVKLGSVPPTAQHYGPNVGEDHRHASWDDAYPMTALDHQKQWNSEHVRLTEANLHSHSGMTQALNPMAHWFTSPIDIDTSDFPARL